MKKLSMLFFLFSLLCTPCLCETDRQPPEITMSGVSDIPLPSRQPTENWRDDQLYPGHVPEFDTVDETTVLGAVDTAYGSTVYFIADQGDGLLIAEVGEASSRDDDDTDLSSVSSPVELFEAIAGPGEAVPDVLLKYRGHRFSAGAWQSSEALPAASSGGCRYRVNAADFDGGGAGRTLNQETYNRRSAGSKSIWWANNRVSAAGHVCLEKGIASWGFQKKDCNRCSWTWLVNPNVANSIGRLFAGESVWWFYTGGQGNNDFNYQSQVYFVSDSTYVHEVSSCYDYYNRTRRWPGSCLAGGCKLSGPGYSTIPGTALRDCDFKGIDPNGIINPWP